MRTVIPKRAVCGDLDVVVLAERDEVVLREEGVRLDLEHGGDDPGGGDDPIEVRDGEVGYADVADLRVNVRTASRSVQMGEEGENL